MKHLVWKSLAAVQQYLSMMKPAHYHCLHLLWMPGCSLDRHCSRCRADIYIMMISRYVYICVYLQYIYVYIYINVCVCVCLSCLGALTVRLDVLESTVDSTLTGFCFGFCVVSTVSSSTRFLSSGPFPLHQFSHRGNPERLSHYSLLLQPS